MKKLKTKTTIENKHMSNIPTSNIQHLTSNVAITLIALIITIIVLLILAGVTLNMVMGDSGIFNKANQAKNKTEIAQYEEELRMCVLELQTDSVANRETFGMETIKNKLVEKVKELENTTDIEFPTEESETKVSGTYKGYEFYIDNKYAAHIGGKVEGISITTSLNPSGWTQGPVTATITIKSNNGISKIKPADENEINVNGAKEYVITKSNITENASYTYEVTDSKGTTQTKTAVINTIDKEAPADFEITASNTEEGLKIEGSTTDALSGIDRYEYYAKKSTDTEYTKYDTNPITGLANGTYSVYAIAYDKAGNPKQSNTVENLTVSKVYTNITAQMVADHPETYYGKTVTNYTSANGQNDWKIFYSDGTHIFLITGDYVKVTGTDNTTIDTDKLNANTNMQKVDESANYRVNWNSSNLPNFQTVTDEIKNRFKATGYDINSYSSNPNSQCVSTLLNASNWEGYKDNSGKAEYAIGGATVELWMDSWNERYPSDKIYCNNTNEYGYYVGTTSSQKGTAVNISSKEGYNNKLYYPHKGGVSDGGHTVEMCWFASTSCYGNVWMLCTYYGGSIDYWDYRGFGGSNWYYAGLRPVVSLNSGITVNAIDAE